MEEKRTISESNILPPGEFFHEKQTEHKIVLVTILELKVKVVVREAAPLAAQV